MNRRVSASISKVLLVVGIMLIACGECFAQIHATLAGRVTDSRTKEPLPADREWRGVRAILDLRPPTHA